MPWTAQYLVMTRASIEANFHTLYAKLLDYLAQAELVTMVIGETFRNIRVLLRSDKGVSNFSDRSLLKNLGHWLGMLTLAKNRPILHEVSQCACAKQAGDGCGAHVDLQCEPGVLTSILVLYQDCM